MILGAKDYLWLLTLLLIKDTRKKTSDNAKTGTKYKKIYSDEKNQNLRDLYKMFGTDIVVQVESLIQMIRKTRENDRKSRSLIGLSEAGHGSHSAHDLFDIYRVKTMSFIQSLLGNHEFMRQIVHDLHKGNETLEIKLQQLLENIILSIEGVHNKSDDTKDEEESAKSEKIQKLLASCLERVFEATLAVIPTSAFVKVLANLLKLEQPKNIQRKALEVLNARLSQQDSCLNDFLDNEDLPMVMSSLSILSLKGSGDVNQQLGMVSKMQIFTV